jgi:lipopolysaccharide/colanic/teichoic acid biosynthesis glycosyltransferase
MMGFGQAKKRAGFLARTTHITMTALSLILLSPIVLVCALLVRLDGGPAFFSQVRVGQNRKIFHIIKLRTMVVGADRFLGPDGKPSRNRVTKIGGFLRRSSLDELPQLWNVLRGEMNFVGPRPILPVMLPFLSATECLRFEVKPGLTGLAQIKGRNHLVWSRRLRYDVIYAKRKSLALDLWIICRTIRMLALREGVVLDRNPGNVDDVTSRAQVSTRR